MAEGSADSIHYDWLIRANLERFGPELASWLFGEEPLAVRTIDTALAAVRIRRADKIFEVQFQSRPTVLLHVEVQTEGRATIPGRMSDYLSMVLNLIKDPRHDGKRLGAVVIYLDRTTYREDPGFLEILGEIGLHVLIRYRVIKLWEEDPGPILRMESPGLCPYVPLMRGNPVELLVKSREKILQAADDRVSFELKKELLGVLAGLATRVVADRELLERVVSEIETMGGNYVFDRFFDRGLKEGMEKGREEGIEKGREQEAREAILRILRHKFGSTETDVSRRLAAISSRSALEALMDDALAAATPEEFLSRIPS